MFRTYGLSRWADIAILCLIIGTACIHSDFLIEGNTVAKRIWLFLFVGVLLILKSFEAIRIKSEFHSLNGLDLSVVLYILFTVVNSNVPNPLLITNLESLALLVVYFFSKIFFKYDKAERYVVKMLTIILLISLSSGLLQYVGLMTAYNDYFPVTGFFFNPGAFSIFLSILLIVAISAIFYSSGLSHAALKIITSLGLIFLIGLMSRAAWIGFLAGLVIVLNYFTGIRTRLYRRIFGRKFSWLYWPVAFLVVVVISIVLYLLKPSSADGRLLIWKISSKMLVDNPIIGIGTDNFSRDFINYQAKYFYDNPDRITREGKLAGDVSFAFNDLIQIACEQGLIGLMLFSIVLCLALRPFFILRNNIDSPNGSGITVVSAILICIIVSSLFSYPLSILPIKGLFFIALGYISHILSNVPDPPATVIIKAPSYIIFISFAVTGGYFLYTTVNYYQAYREWYIVEQKRYEGYSIDSLQHHHTILWQNPRFHAKKAADLIMRSRYSEALIILENARLMSSNTGMLYQTAFVYSQLKQYDKAEKQYLLLKFAEPGLLRPRYALAMLYYRTGQMKKWKQEAREVIAFEPKIKSSFTEAL